MNTTTALEYVDLVIEALVDLGIITENAYGRMKESTRQDIAEVLAERINNDAPSRRAPLA